MNGENIIIFLNNHIFQQINFLVSGITGGGVYFQQTKHKTLKKWINISSPQTFPLSSNDVLYTDTFEMHLAEN